jgi:hypothetical protein
VVVVVVKEVVVVVVVVLVVLKGRGRRTKNTVASGTIDVVWEVVDNGRRVQQEEVVASGGVSTMLVSYHKDWCAGSLGSH